MIPSESEQSPPESPAWVDPLTRPVSLFGTNIHHTTPRQSLPLGDMLGRIKTGYYGAVIADLQALRPTLTDEEYRAAKEKLPAFTPCCQLTTRAQKVPWDKKLVDCTGIVHIDYDQPKAGAGVPFDPASTKGRLSHDAAVVFAFQSPSGGVKVGLAATGITDAETYAHAWAHVTALFQERYPDLTASTDTQVKYLNALCFVSHDPTLYVNPHAVPVEVPAYQAPAAPDVPPEPGEGIPFATLAQALFFLPTTLADDYGEWLAMGMRLHKRGTPWAKMLWDTWSQQSSKYTQDAQDKKWKTFKADGERHPGEILTMAYEQGWRPAGSETATETINLVNRPEKIDAADPHEIRPKAFSSLNSLTSYPWPKLREEALHGLAGEYVNTVSPYSESDPAALLMQFLATYGVVIGRQRFFEVEATRHYTNVSAVIVSRTARSRKGTSYSHIERCFVEGSLGWSLANYIKGCGSGEGLIHAVRDARWGKSAIKEKGRIIDYQEELLDEGVSDKRGLYHTAEFALVLKVAAREGNTLSEVIRDAWDTGYLRNTVQYRENESHDSDQCACCPAGSYHGG